MATTCTIPPATWWHLATGVWLHIDALDDPLLRVELHRVTVHRDADDHIWLVVDGPNAGVRVQSLPPDDLPGEAR